MNGNQASDRQFWLDAAQESCAFFNRTVHPITGLNQDYSEFSGVAKGDAYGDTGTHDDFCYVDSIQVVVTETHYLGELMGVSLFANSTPAGVFGCGRE